MRSILILVFLFLLLGSLRLQAQYFRDSQTAAMDFLEKKKLDFKNATNDSSFIIQNSDSPFKYYTFSRGDQKEDIEDQIYNAKIGDVVGPFRGDDSSNYLFKIISFEKYAVRSKAKIIYFRSNGDSKQDTASISKLTEKYMGYILKNKDIKSHAHKEDVRIIFKDPTWYYEGDTNKEYYDLVMNMKQGESILINTPQGKAILQVSNCKEKTPYTIRLIAVIKKG
jgi:hypothetical protein